MKNDAEPPSCLQPPIFMVGQDSRGGWVVAEKRGMRGGLFADRTQALRYIRSENGNRPYAFVTVTSVFELTIAPPSAVVPQFTADAARERRVA
jgi:hypothetical protein